MRRPRPRPTRIPPDPVPPPDPDPAPDPVPPPDPDPAPDPVPPPDPDPAPDPVPPPDPDPAPDPAPGAKLKTPWSIAKVGDAFTYKMGGKMSQTWKVVKVDDENAHVEQTTQIPGMPAGMSAAFDDGQVPPIRRGGQERHGRVQGHHEGSGDGKGDHQRQGVHLQGRRNDGHHEEPDGRGGEEDHHEGLDVRRDPGRLGQDHDRRHGHDAGSDGTHRVQARRLTLRTQAVQNRRNRPGRSTRPGRFCHTAAAASPSRPRNVRATSPILVGAGRRGDVASLGPPRADPNRRGCPHASELPPPGRVPGLRVQRGKGPRTRQRCRGLPAAGAVARFGSLRFVHGSPVHCLAWSPDGKMIATGGPGKGKPIRLWDVATGRQIRTVHRARCRYGLAPSWYVVARLLARRQAAGERRRTGVLRARLRRGDRRQGVRVPPRRRGPSGGPQPSPTRRVPRRRRHGGQYRRRSTMSRPKQSDRASQARVAGIRRSRPAGGLRHRCPQRLADCPAVCRQSQERRRREADVRRDHRHRQRRQMYRFECARISDGVLR